MLLDMLSLPYEDQARICAAFFRRPSHYFEGLRAAGKALKKLGPRTVQQCLAEDGIRIIASQEESRIGTVVTRARLDGLRKRLVIYERALLDLRGAAMHFGLPMQCDVRDIVIAHEGFHHLQPKITGVVAEAGAHIFASIHLGLAFYSEVLDVAELMYRKALQVTSLEYGTLSSW
jgi:hypothetical protein